MKRFIEQVLFLVLGAFIGWGISYYFYKESEKDSSLQLKKIQNEFKILGKKVDSLDLTTSSNEQLKEVKDIQESIQRWVSYLDKDLGNVENKIDKKLLAHELDEKEKSIILRKYVFTLLSEIDSFIEALNKEERDISWSMPILHKSIFEHNSNVDILLDEKVLANVNLYVLMNKFVVEITSLDKNKSRIVFSFGYSTNNEISLLIYPIESFKSLIEKKTIYINNGKTIDNTDILKKTFEYLLVKQ